MLFYPFLSNTLQDSSRLIILIKEELEIHEIHAIQFFIIYSRNFDVDINAIQQRTRDSLLVFDNDSRRTRFLWIV
jgi:hypothetical protein